MPGIANVTHDERVTLWVAEPPPVFAARPLAVVDCSVVAAALFLESEAGQAGAQTRGFDLKAPSLLAYELANVAANKLRRKELTLDAICTHLRGFDPAVIKMIEVPAQGAFALAARCGLTAYDAAYLWLAAELRVPLLTFDRRLGEAAVEHMKTLGAR